MEIFLFMLAAIILIFVLRNIFRTFAVTKEIKLVINNLNNIKNNKLTLKQVQDELDAQNIEYFLSDNGTLHWQILNNNNWIFTFNRLGFSVSVQSHEKSIYNGIELKLCLYGSSYDEAWIEGRFVNYISKPTIDAMMMIKKFPYYDVKLVNIFTT